MMVIGLVGHPVRPRGSRPDGELLQSLGARRLLPVRRARRGPDAADRHVRLSGRRADRRDGGRSGEPGERAAPGHQQRRSTGSWSSISARCWSSCRWCPGTSSIPARARSCSCSRTWASPAAAGIINFVVITAAASSCNSGIFSTGRMLYTLAQVRPGPARLRQGQRPAMSRRRASRRPRCSC